MKKSDLQKIKNFEALVKGQEKTFVGYPVNTQFDYSDLYGLLSYPLNNVGDPFAEGYYHLNSREFELEVLDWFARLNHAPLDNYWG